MEGTTTNTPASTSNSSNAVSATASTSEEGLFEEWTLEDWSGDVGRLTMFKPHPLLLRDGDGQGEGEEGKGKEEEMYDLEELLVRENQRRFGEEPHRPAFWLRTFKHCTSAEFMKSTPRAKASGCHHALRLVIIYQTMNICRAGYIYQTDTGKVIRGNEQLLHSYLKRTTLYRNAPQLSAQAESKKALDTQVVIYEGDCIETALELRRKFNVNPVVLNMANAVSPGGGYLHGDGAQEENLHRRSNYFQSLHDPQGISTQGRLYPIPIEGAIYSPNIFVFRESEAKGYAFMNPPVLLSFIACPAPHAPPLVRNPQGREPLLADEAIEGIKAKMRTILSVGVHHGHDAIVLSAFGCGAFRCPPRHIAQLFKEVMAEAELVGRYKVIAFGIFDDHNAHRQHNPDGNVKPFSEVFGIPSVPLVYTHSA